MPNIPKDKLPLLILKPNRGRKDMSDKKLVDTKITRKNVRIYWISILC